MNENIKAGGDIHAGDGGYSIGTKEKYDEFVKNRNRMNERIKELSIKAGFPEWSNHAIEFELEKFAELIVRECAEQIIAKGTDWVDFAPSQTGVRPEYWDMAQQIKEHFGVKE